MLCFFQHADLCERWNYTKAGIHKLVKHSDFPKPFTIVSRGKMKIFSEEAIRHYEQDKPWLLDENQKIRRQRLYLMLQHIKAAEPHKKRELINKLFGTSVDR